MVLIPSLLLLAWSWVIQYELLVDINARWPRRPSIFKPQNFYGQLQSVVVLRLSPSAPLGLDKAATLALGIIRNCPIEESHTGGLDIHYYSKPGALDVVDLSSIQCLVGRIWDGRKWAFIDRSGSLSRAVFVDEDLE